MNSKYQHIINLSTDSDKFKDTVKSLKISEFNDMLTQCKETNNDKSINVAFSAITTYFLDKSMIKQHVSHDNLVFILKNAVIQNKTYTFSYLMDCIDVRHTLESAINSNNKKDKETLFNFIVKSEKFEFLDSALANSKEKESFANSIILNLTNQPLSLGNGFTNNRHENKINQLINNAFKYVNFSNAILPTVFINLLASGMFQERTWNRDDFGQLVHHEIISSYTFAAEKAFKLFINKYAKEIPYFDINGYTALTYICKKYSEEGVIDFLEEFSKNADLVNKKDAFEKYPLDYYDLEALKKAGATEKSNHSIFYHFKNLIHVFKDAILSKKVLKNTAEKVDSVNQEEKVLTNNVNTTLTHSSLEAQKEIMDNLNIMATQFKGGVKTSILLIQSEVEQLFIQTSSLLDVYEKTPNHIYDSVEDIVFIKNNIIKNVNYYTKDYMKTFDSLKGLVGQDEKISKKAQEMSDILLSNIHQLSEQIGQMQEKMIDRITDNSKANLQTQQLKLKMLSQKN
jgi:hypothetical protein